MNNKKPKLIFIVLNVVIMIVGFGFIMKGASQLWFKSDSPKKEYVYATPDIAKAMVTDEGIMTNEEITSNGVINKTIDEFLYPVYPKEGDNIGSLVVPKLELELPIFQGTAENELKRGVGHFMQSVLPGEIDNCVLSGHRESEFRKIGDLVVGDLLVVKTSAGSFTYEVSSIQIVDKDDRTIIVPKDHGVLTLTTCYPFHYFGSAPSRYIVSANLVVEK